jgi:hypothetical protein
MWESQHECSLWTPSHVSHMLLVLWATHLQNVTLVLCVVWNVVGWCWGFLPSQARELSCEAADWLVSQGQYTK